MPLEGDCAGRGGVGNCKIFEAMALAMQFRCRSAISTCSSGRRVSVFTSLDKSALWEKTTQSAQWSPITCLNPDAIPSLKPLRRKLI